MGINPISKRIYERKQREACLKSNYTTKCKKAAVSGLISTTFIAISMLVAGLLKDPEVLSKILAFSSMGVGLFSAIMCKEYIEEAIYAKKDIEDFEEENEM